MRMRCQSNRFGASWFLLSMLILSWAPCSIAHPFDLGNAIESNLSGSVLKSDIALDLMHLKSKDVNITSGVTRFTAFRDIQDPIREILEEKGLSPLIAVKSVRDVRGQSADVRSQENVTSDYDFFVGAYPICGARMRTIKHFDGSLAIAGTIPLVDQFHLFSENEWPDLQETAGFAIATIAANQNITTDGARILSSRRCLLNEQGRLDPVWDLAIDFGGFSFDAWSTPWHLASASQRYLDATATVRAYSPNIKQGQLKDFAIEVNGDGTMSNSHFTTSDSRRARRAVSANNSFVFQGPSEPGFAEASTFAYVNQQYEFLTAMGYQWLDSSRVKIVLVEKFSNAMYDPPNFETNYPRIYIGDGDGNGLQNLQYDADVISHEFGHHVVFQSITDVRSEDAKILHEGLADFLALSRTGNACLAESVCPAGSAICMIESKCLRTADNKLTYNDDTYASFAKSYHRKGQLVSGFLWDMKKDGGIPSDTLTRYVIEAINYLPSAASLKSLVAAILYVDQRHEAIYQAVILQAAERRKLSPADLGIELADLGASIKTPVAASAGNGGEEDSDGKKGFLGCAVIGKEAVPDQSSSFYVVLALFAMPLLMRLPRMKLKRVRRSQSSR